MIRLISIEYSPFPSALFGVVDVVQEPGMACHPGDHIARRITSDRIQHGTQVHAVPVGAGDAQKGVDQRSQRGAQLFPRVHTDPAQDRLGTI